MVVRSACDPATAEVFRISLTCLDIDRGPSVGAGTNRAFGTPSGAHSSLVKNLSSACKWPQLAFPDTTSRWGFPWRSTRRRRADCYQSSWIAKSSFWKHGHFGSNRESGFPIYTLGSSVASACRIPRKSDLTIYGPCKVYSAGTPATAKPKLGGAVPLPERHWEGRRRGPRPLPLRFLLSGSTRVGHRIPPDQTKHRPPGCQSCGP